MQIYGHPKPKPWSNIRKVGIASFIDIQAPQALAPKQGPPKPFLPRPKVGKPAIAPDRPPNLKLDLNHIRFETPSFP
ncbi:MAG: hypothetical protein AAFQ89_20520 [Cyanobacteria bacterium J06626_18]